VSAVINYSVVDGNIMEMACFGQSSMVTL